MNLRLLYPPYFPNQVAIKGAFRIYSGRRGEMTQARLDPLFLPDAPAKLVRHDRARPSLLGMGAMVQPRL